jgi:hypothetical protein
MSRWFLGFSLVVAIAATLGGVNSAKASAQSMPSPSPSASASPMSSMHP